MVAFDSLRRNEPIGRYPLQRIELQLDSWVRSDKIYGSVRPIPRQPGPPDPESAALACVQASGVATPSISQPRPPGIGSALHASHATKCYVFRLFREVAKPGSRRKLLINRGLWLVVSGRSFDDN